MRKKIFAAGLIAGVVLPLLMAATGGFPSRPRFLSVGVGTTAPAGTGTLNATTDVQVGGVSLCRSNGTNCPAGTTLAAPAQAVQFNNGAGNLGGDADFTWTPGTNTMNLGGGSIINVPTAGNLVFQEGGSERMRYDAATDSWIIASVGGLQTGGYIQTTGGSNFIANAGGTFYGGETTTVSKPAFASNAAGSQNSGIYFPSTDVIGFACDGANCGNISAAQPLNTTIVNAATGCSSATNLLVGQTLIARKTVDQSITNDAVRDADADLCITGLSGTGRYKFDGVVLMTQAGPTFPLQSIELSAVSGETVTHVDWFCPSGGSSGSGQLLGSGSTLQTGARATDCAIAMQGVHKASSTSIFFAWAQAVSDAGALTLRRGSYIAVTRLE